ncbi:hypothetical protein [Hymenobacter sp. B81]|uniref:hypothetical protein n=1 Tax=Hymenobacter sp. B81 TaxID=3344878 RepID=UPI0037DCB3BB
MITHIQADLADWRDSRYLLGIVDATRHRLLGWRLVLQNVVADAGYGSGENYAQLEPRGLTGYIPSHGKYQAERAGFTYDAGSDSYVCRQGKRLAFDRVVVDAQGNAKKRYMGKTSDCRTCPLAAQCKGQQSK